MFVLARCCRQVSINATNRHVVCDPSTPPIISTGNRAITRKAFLSGLNQVTNDFKDSLNNDHETCVFVCVCVFVRIIFLQVLARLDNVSTFYSPYITIILG